MPQLEQEVEQVGPGDLVAQQRLDPLPRAAVRVDRPDRRRDLEAEEEPVQFPLEAAQLPGDDEGEQQDRDADQDRQQRHPDTQADDEDDEVDEPGRERRDQVGDVEVGLRPGGDQQRVPVVLPPEPPGLAMDVVPGFGVVEFHGSR